MADEKEIISVVRAKSDWSKFFKRPAEIEKETKDIEKPHPVENLLTELPKEPVEESVQDNTVKAGIIPGKLIPKSSLPGKIFTVGPLVVIAALLGLLLWNKISSAFSVSSFDDCTKMKGSRIQESYPETCITKDGKQFVQDIPSEPVETLAPCIIGGCNAELCTSGEENIASDCVYKPGFECFQGATCERQEDKSCGWTQSKELTTCLDKYKTSQ